MNILFFFVHTIIIFLWEVLLMSENKNNKNNKNNNNNKNNQNNNQNERNNNSK